MRTSFFKRRIARKPFPGRFVADAAPPRSSWVYSRSQRGGEVRFWWFILVAMSSMVFNSCGLFSTRGPESPTNSTSTGDIALTAQEVVTQLSDALSLHDPNLYLNVIDDEFRFECTAQAYPDGQDYFDYWSFNQESNFIQNLLSLSMLPADSFASFEFELVQQQEAADSVVYLQHYILEIHLVRSDLPNVYEGLATFSIYRGVDGGWRIRNWLDDVSGENPTMSRLRASL